MAKSKSLFDQSAFCFLMEQLSNAERITDMLQTTADSWRNSPMAIIAQGGLCSFFFFPSKPLQDGKEETAFMAHYLVISGMGIPFWSIPNPCVLGAPGLAGLVAPAWQLLPASPGHQVFREPQHTL